MKTKTVSIDTETRDVLYRGEWQGENYYLPDEQLERPLYMKVNKVLLALGGKWARGSQAHVFSPEAAAAAKAKLKEVAGGVGEIVDVKKTLEQFFTPITVAEQLIELVGDLRFAHVLEPSAGKGALIEAAFEAGASYVTAVEVDPDLAHGLQHTWGGHSSPVDVFQGDFMKIELPDRCTPPIDVVLMNPPFSSNKDIEHVMRAWELLAPGGRLGAIMSPHFTFASDRKSMEFRDFMRDHSGRVHDLGAKAFSGSGTDVRTMIVVLEKPRS